MNIIHTPPSQESQAMLEALRESVSNALRQKQQLGHYAVLWANNKPIQRGADAPDALASISPSV